MMPLSTGKISPRRKVSPEACPKPTTCTGADRLPVTRNFFASRSFSAAPARWRPSLPLQSSSSVEREMAASSASLSSRM